MSDEFDIIAMINAALTEERLDREEAKAVKSQQEEDRYNLLGPIAICLEELADRISSHDASVIYAWDDSNRVDLWFWSNTKTTVSGSDRRPTCGVHAQARTNDNGSAEIAIWYGGAQRAPNAVFESKSERAVLAVLNVIRPYLPESILNGECR